MASKPLDVEATEAHLADLSDTELYKLQVGNKVLTLFATNPSFARIQKLVEAEVERRKKAHPDRWVALRDALRK
jgi:hypothetical protein